MPRPERSRQTTDEETENSAWNEKERFSAKRQRTGTVLPFLADGRESSRPRRCISLRWAALRSGNKPGRLSIRRTNKPATTGRAFSTSRWSYTDAFRRPGGQGSWIDPRRGRDAGAPAGPPGRPPPRTPSVLPGCSLTRPDSGGGHTIRAARLRENQPSPKFKVLGTSARTSKVRRGFVPTSSSSPVWGRGWRRVDRA